MFNALETKNKCVEWIRDFFDKNGKNCIAVVGISGGKDSSVTAALLKEALGKERVFGVLMPCGTQADISASYKLVNHLQIKYCEINIFNAVEGLKNEILLKMDLTRQCVINMPARIRMTTLYAVAQCMNGRVANTCNLSEDYVGYATRYGDGAGDFSPLCKLTVTEVKQIGKVLGLPDELIYKTPIDGLSGKSDEENLGFTYDELDKYIRFGQIENKEHKEKIDTLYKNNKFKLEPMPYFDPDN